MKRQNSPSKPEVEPAYRALIKHDHTRGRTTRKQPGANPSNGSDDDEPHHERFHRLPAVRKRYGNPSTSTIFRWLDQGIFPASEPLGPNYNAWRESTLSEYDADPQG